MHFSAIVVAVICASSPLVAGHAAIIGAQGDAGGNGSAIGIVGSTPRDGTRRNPFQADATRFRGDAADTCGETIGAGTNDVESGTQQVLAASGNTLPQVSPGGQLQMTLHQVNSDGAGPYTCMIDPTGTGTQWTQINVAQNVPGSRRGRNRDGEATDFVSSSTPFFSAAPPSSLAHTVLIRRRLQSLVADMPAGMSCTGTVAGQTNVCMVRCQNPARAGPFGGCVPVQQSGAGANNAAATPAAGGAAGIATPAAGAGTAGTAGTAGSANAGTAGSAGLSAGATTGTNNAFGQSAAGAADSAAADAQEEEEEEEEEDEDEEDRKKARSEQSTSGQADSAAADAADRENEAEDEAEDRAVKVIQRRVKINLVA
ncbi:hypothetical protein DIS24_g6077 [Lasiodiplodia hormozganensis]|uniref:Uncharacterized protein n=1 Tax=Lasiodiplodia hormozganensis TaxID=869390 RepID=A0AA39YIW0_9PEZI|nr:hypothetical protein DIS24_g6077 [Lasiodiplodia hormozganensis]